MSDPFCQERLDNKFRCVLPHGHRWDSTDYKARVAELEAEVARLRGALLARRDSDRVVAESRMGMVEQLKIRMQADLLCSEALGSPRDEYEELKLSGLRRGLAALAAPPKPWVQCTSVTNDCLGGCRTAAEHARYNAAPPPPKLETGEEAGARLKGRRPAPKPGPMACEHGTPWTHACVQCLKEHPASDVLVRAGWLSPEAVARVRAKLQDIANEYDHSDFCIKTTGRSRNCTCSTGAVLEALALLDGAKP